MPSFPENPRPNAVYVAFDFGGLLFRFDGVRWVADAADVMRAFERMASDRERRACERVIAIYERFGLVLPADATKELSG